MRSLFISRAGTPEGDLRFALLASLSRLFECGVRSACWCVECDRAANVDAPLFADGWLFESCYRSPGHQLL
jgi:hypothetical protein